MCAVFEALSRIELKWLRNSDLVNSTKSFSLSLSISAALVRAISSDLLSSPSELSLLRWFLRISSFPDLKKGTLAGGWKSEARSGGVAVNSCPQEGQTTLRPARSRATEQLVVQAGQSWMRTWVMQWAEARTLIIPVVAGKICPPRNCGDRGVFENLDDFSCNTPNQPIWGGIPRIKDPMGRSETGFGVIPAQQFGALAGGLSSTDQNRPLKSCSARLVYSLVYSSPKSGSLGVQVCPKGHDQNPPKTAWNGTFDQERGNLSEEEKTISSCVRLAKDLRAESVANECGLDWTAHLSTQKTDRKTDR